MFIISRLIRWLTGTVEEEEVKNLPRVYMRLDIDYWGAIRNTAGLIVAAFVTSLVLFNTTVGVVFLDPITHHATLLSLVFSGFMTLFVGSTWVFYIAAWYKHLGNEMHGEKVGDFQWMLGERNRRFNGWILNIEKIGTAKELKLGEIHTTQIQTMADKLNLNMFVFTLALQPIKRFVLYHIAEAVEELGVFIAQMGIHRGFFMNMSMAPFQHARLGEVITDDEVIPQMIPAADEYYRKRQLVIDPLRITEAEYEVITTKKIPAYITTRYKEQNKTLKARIKGYEDAKYDWDSDVQAGVAAEEARRRAKREGHKESQGMSRKQAVVVAGIFIFFISVIVLYAIYK